jgi:hypothetical protein
VSATSQPPRTLEPALLAAGFGGPERLVRLAELLRPRDPPVQIAALTAAATLWDDPAAGKSVPTWLLAALDDPTLGVVGAAADAIAARPRATPRETADDPLWRALERRARGALDARARAVRDARRHARGDAGARPAPRLRARPAHANPQRPRRRARCIRRYAAPILAPQGPGGPPAAPRPSTPRACSASACCGR